MHTHWLQSILENYQVLQTTWEQTMEFTADTKIKARILGVFTQMSRFDFVFGTVLGQLILGHSSNLMRKMCSDAEAQEVAEMLIITLRGIQTEFDLLQAQLARISESLDIDEAELLEKGKCLYIF